MKGRRKDSRKDKKNLKKEHHLEHRNMELKHKTLGHVFNEPVINKEQWGAVFKGKETLQLLSSL